MPYLIKEDLRRRKEKATKMLGEIGDLISTGNLDVPKPSEEWRTQFLELIDASHAADIAETVIVSSRQVEQLITAKGYGSDLEYRLPFDATCLQFDIPIPEGKVTSVYDASVALWRESDAEIYRGIDQIERRLDDDRVCGLILLNENLTPSNVNVAIVYYTSGSIGRVVWNSLGEFLHFGDPEEGLIEYRKSIRRLAELVIAFLNAENVELVRQSPSSKVNRKREKRGKKPLPDFYVTRFTDSVSRGSSDLGQGHSPSFRFDVRGHFRRLQSGKIIWVRPHQRGLANEIYRPRDYYDATGKKV